MDLPRRPLKSASGKRRGPPIQINRDIDPEDIDQYYRDRYEKQDDWWRDEDGEDNHR